LSQGKVEDIEDAYRQKLVEVNERSGISRMKGLDILISSATWQYKLHSNHNLVIATIHAWLFVQNVNVLSGSTGELAYQKIIHRAETSLNIAKAIGTVAQRIQFDAYIADVMIRYNFKSDDYDPTEENTSSLDDKTKIIEKIVKLLDDGITMADYYLLDTKTNAIVNDMEKRYSVWNSLLSKCLVLSTVRNANI